MNSLSWMIYLADVAAHLNWVLDIITFMGVIGAVIWFSSLFTDECWDAKDWAIWRKAGKTAVSLAAAGVVLGAVIPTSETIYAIAASEMGETALNSETGSKAVKALNAWLDRQIAGEEPAK